jgi:hypothetical protein
MKTVGQTVDRKKLLCRLDLSIYANDGQQVCEQAVHKDAIICRLQSVLPIMVLWASFVIAG